MKKYGAAKLLGLSKKNSALLSGLESSRRIVDKNGILAADTVFVPLEDGDRTLALKKSGKKVITVDLNPLSRTALNADITIIDNITRAMPLLIEEVKAALTKDKIQLKKLVESYDNRTVLKQAVSHISLILNEKADFQE
jgi:4-phosphopantoate--beta-alanine ligase